MNFPFLLPRFRSRDASKAFSLIEVLVVVAIIALLAAIVFPVFGRARENARKSSCQSNLKQLGLAFAQYTQDFDERLPNATRGPIGRGEGKTGGWVFYSSLATAPNSFDVTRGSLFSYAKNAQIFLCPSDSLGQSTGNSYAINECLSLDQPNGIALGKSLAAFQETTRWMLLAEETNGGFDGSDGSTDDGLLVLANSISTRHLSGLNLAFLDGHVKWYRPERMWAEEFSSGGAPVPMPRDSAVCP